MFSFYCKDNHKKNLTIKNKLFGRFPKRSNRTRANLKENQSQIVITSVNKQQTCKHCGTIYKTLSDFKKHVRFEEKLYCCHHCDTPDKITKQELINHCKAVGINYKEPNFFRKAMTKRPRMVNPCERICCEICSQEFKNKTLMEEHYEEFHKNHYKCEVCDEGFKKILEYIFHMKTHSDENLYRCALCNYTTPYRHIVNKHLKDKHDQFRKHVCESCGKGFSVFTHFLEHKKYFHSGERPFQCDHCGKRFMYSRYLKTHLAHLHKIRTEDELKCSFCGKSFPTSQALINHRIKQHPKHLHMCEMCGKTFNTKSLLALHSSVHSSEKTYGCSFCEKKFKRRSFLVQHERVHTGEKPHVCTHCGKGFSQRSSMVIHTRRHTGELPYGCHLCNKAFASGNLLTNHRKKCKGVPFIIDN